MKIVLLVIFFGSSALAQNYPWQKDFETYVEQIMQTYKVPAFAIEVVGPQGPLLQITKGYRNIEKNLPVTPQTLFAIGSTTKAFTGVLLAQLADQGKINFDGPVQRYLPEFAIKDPVASQSLNLRDLMGHWTGVGRHDLAWYHRGLSRAQMLSLIPLLDVSAPPRTEFIYNNWMWAAVGSVTEAVSKLAWEDQLQRQIFSPLGMRRSNSSIGEMLKSDDYSEAYDSDGQNIVKQAFLDLAGANPAGGINSNLDDMAKWVQFHLNHGRANGQALISEALLEETYKAYSKASDTVGYAMGWLVTTRGGQRWLTHDGSVDGFSSNVSFMPEKGFGVVILTNRSPVVPQMVAMNLWQRLNGEPPVDFVAENSVALGKKQMADRLKYPDLPTRPPALPLTAYVGNFCHPAYGKARISSKPGSELQLDFSVLSVPIYPVGGNDFQMHGIFGVLKNVGFAESNGVAQKLSLSLEASMKDPVQFARCH